MATAVAAGHFMIGVIRAAVGVVKTAVLRRSGNVLQRYAAVILLSQPGQDIPTVLVQVQGVGEI